MQIIKLQKIIEYILYFLIFLLPLQTRYIFKDGILNQGYLEYGTISLYAVDILLIVLITFAIFDYFKNKKQLKLAQNKKIIYILASIGVLELAIFSSIFVATDKLLAFHYYLKYLLGICLFFIIIYSKYDYKKLIYSLFIGTFFHALLGIWQFLTQTSFSNKWLGIAMHDPTQPGTSVIEAFSLISTDTFALNGERWLRAYGGLDHPNILGGLLVITLLLIIIHLIRVSSSQFMTIRNKNKLSDDIKKNNESIFKIIKILISYILLFTFLTALFFTFSRSAWLGFITGIFVLFSILIYKKQEKRFKKLFEICATITLLLIILFNQFSNLVLTRIDANSRLETKSSQDRLTSYNESWKIIKENWFWGVGAGNYTLALNDANAEKKPSWYYHPPHNIFLLIWSEIGIIGLLSFISLIILILINFKNLKYTASILITILIIGMFDHWLWSLHFGILLFWFSLGIIVKKSIMSKSQKSIKSFNI